MTTFTLIYLFTGATYDRLALGYGIPDFNVRIGYGLVVNHGGYKSHLSISGTHQIEMLETKDIKLLKGEVGVEACVHDNVPPTHLSLNLTTDKLIIPSFS